MHWSMPVLALETLDKADSDQPTGPPAPAGVRSD